MIKYLSLKFKIFYSVLLELLLLLIESNISVTFSIKKLTFFSNDTGVDKFINFLLQSKRLEINCY